VWQLRGSIHGVIMALLVLWGFGSVVAGGNLETGLMAARPWMTGLVVFLIFSSSRDGWHNCRYWKWLNLVVVGWMVLWLVVPFLGFGLGERLMGGSDLEMKLMEWGRGRLLPIGAIYITVLIPMFYGKLGRWLVVGGILAVVMSGYRSMFVALVMGLVWLVFVHKRFGLGLIVLAVIFLVLTGTTSSRSLWQRLLMEDPEDKKTLLARRDYVIDAFNYFRESPVFGIGWGNFAVYSKPMVVGNKSDPESVIVEAPGSPHSQPVLWLAETGVVGCGLYLIWLVGFGVSDWKKWRESNNEVRLLVIASWMYVLGSWLDAYPTYGLLTFCIIRGMLEGVYAGSNSA